MKVKVNERIAADGSRTYQYPEYRGEINGTYKLTDDFEAEVGGVRRVVRDVNFTPDDRRLPDLAICRIFSDRIDAETVIRALRSL